MKRPKKVIDLTKYIGTYTIDEAKDLVKKLEAEIAAANPVKTYKFWYEIRDDQYFTRPLYERTIKAEDENKAGNKFLSAIKKIKFAVPVNTCWCFDTKSYLKFQISDEMMKLMNHKKPTRSRHSYGMSNGG